MVDGAKFSGCFYRSLASPTGRNFLDGLTYFRKTVPMSFHPRDYLTSFRFPPSKKSLASITQWAKRKWKMQFLFVLVKEFRDVCEYIAIFHYPLKNSCHGNGWSWHVLMKRRQILESFRRCQHFNFKTVTKIYFEADETIIRSSLVNKNFVTSINSCLCPNYIQHHPP